ncbi:hypothetical protein GGX14DRAFT_562897 [Mycena pura]|uniref:Uncharacterized protein n=1 Tax=Mycena pura TaxID=153505 RepID=A0AAD6VL29_9AGAR|nr:hypothetical protein GGX14DRAFT_562897 [Mycena pura]
MDCQFSFGPNRSYFCSAESHFAWSDNNLPPALLRVLQKPQDPYVMEGPYDVAFPIELGAYMMCWRKSRGETSFEAGCMGPHYARLARFIKNAASVPGGHTTRTVFGPNASFFSMSETGYCWQNLPQALEDGIHASIRVRRPKCVALGARGAYVALYTDGTVTFDLMGVYPLVDGMIRNTQEAARRKGIMYVALNPHMPGEYYAVYGDGSATWSFPTAWTTNVTTVSLKIKPIALQPPPPPPRELPGQMQVSVSAGGTGPPVSSGGTSSAHSPSPAPVPVAAPTFIPAPSPIPALPAPTFLNAPSPVSLRAPTPSTQPSVGGSTSSLPTVGQTYQAVAQEVTPASYTMPIVAPTFIPAPSPIPAPSSIPAPTFIAAPSPTPSTQPSVGGSMSSFSTVGQTYQAVPQEVTPPAYTPVGSSVYTSLPQTPPSQARAHVHVPVHAQTLPSPPTQTPAQLAPEHHHKITWKEGLTMGLKVAQGAGKIYNAIEGHPQQHQQNGGSGGFDAGSLIGMALHAVEGQPQQQQQHSQSQAHSSSGGIDAAASIIGMAVHAIEGQTQQQGQQQDQSSGGGFDATSIIGMAMHAIEGQPQQQDQSQDQSSGGGFDAGSIINMAMHALGGDGQGQQDQSQNGQNGGVDASALYNMGGMGMVVVDQGQGQMVQETVYYNGNFTAS